MINRTHVDSIVNVGVSGQLDTTCMVIQINQEGPRGTQGGAWKGPSVTFEHSN